MTSARWSDARPLQYERERRLSRGHFSKLRSPMREALICEPLRTPVGRFGGVFRDLAVTELATTVIKELLARTQIPPESVDDVILGQGYANGEAPALGRVAALDAGLPVEVPGVQVDRRCGSGLQAVLDAAMQVQTGVADLIIAGGAESMSQAELYSTGLRWGARSGGAMLEDRLVRGRVTAGGTNYPVPGGMIETAENLRREYGIPRAEQDELALRSHRRAVAAQQNGTFAEEIVPVEIRDRKNGTRKIDRDEHPRADASLETLASLRPVMGRKDPEATVTAGNASGQNDGAAVCIVTHADRAAELNLKPLARLVSWAAAGVPPRTMGIGPVPGDRQGDGARRADARRHGSDRAQRGVRRAGAGGAARVGPARRTGARQRQRLGDLARPSDRRDRRPDPDDAAARADAAAAAATASRRCASAAARGSRPCSRTSTRPNARARRRRRWSPARTAPTRSSRGRATSSGTSSLDVGAGDLQAHARGHDLEPVLGMRSVALERRRRPIHGWPLAGTIDAAAATNIATRPKMNADDSACENGAEITDGKNVWPSRMCCWAADTWWIPGPSSVLTGL